MNVAPMGEKKKTKTQRRLCMKDAPLRGCRRRLYQRVPGDGDDGTARSVPGDEVCRPDRKRRKNT